MALRKSLLLELLSQPTAPFREGHVARCILALLEENDVPFFQDDVGNIVVGVASATALRKLLKSGSGAAGKEPLRVFMAHMDHPGFHGEKWIDDSTLEIRWHGGSPVAYVEGAPVWLASAQGYEASGEIGSAKILESKRSIETAQIKLSAPLRGKFKRASDLFGGFRFRKPVWEEGDLLYTKAADDLVGTFSILSIALDLYSGRKKKNKPPFLAVLTRAEEVGFIGAIAHLELFGKAYAAAKRPVLFVSLETSRTLPNAEIGKGPIVRTGDRFTVFQPGSLRVLLDVAERVLPKKYQSRIMDGGACEASAATVYGLPAIGISIPLGNYHNQGLEGGPDSGGPLGPAPEFVHASDIEGMIALCHGLLKAGLGWTDPWSKRRTGFKKSYTKAKKLLKQGLGVS